VNSKKKTRLPQERLLVFQPRFFKEVTLFDNIWKSDLLNKITKQLTQKIQQTIEEELAFSRDMAKLSGEPHWSDFLSKDDLDRVKKGLTSLGAGFLGQKKSRSTDLDAKIAHEIGCAIGNGIRKLQNSATARREQNRRMAQMSGQYSLKQLKALDPIDFEFWTANYFRQFGFRNVTVTTFSSDFGVDVAMSTPKGKKAIVQCKRYTGGSTIGRPTVQQTYGAMKLLEVDMCYVVTTSRFTPLAMELNKRRDITLLDGEFLVSGKRPPGSR
jgi:hypothetical protein